MEEYGMDTKNMILASLPKVDQTMEDHRLIEFFKTVPRPIIVEAVRETIEQERQRILRSDDPGAVISDEELFHQIEKRIRAKASFNLTTVINSTGIILHTNLGRAVLSERACRQIGEVAQNYCNLEYDTDRGGRGHRCHHVEELLCRVTGAEAATVVNNNAAATLLCLSALAGSGEVPVSRGELVEIGGSFRMPEIMEQSGTRLVEVGTTNKTGIGDYEKAISDETAALMKVHTSNYRIIGFTSETSIGELVKLGDRYGLPVIHDLGSGLLVDLKSCGIHEPTVQQSIEAGADIVMFSGDKLMGGPQAGIIVGRKEYIERIKGHPLARAFRSDKLTLAAMEGTLMSYLDPDLAMREIPVLRMLTESEERVRSRGEALKEKLMGLRYIVPRVEEVYEQIGGGSAPMFQLKGTAVKLISQIPEEWIGRRLRENEVPIISRIYREEVYLDMRTTADRELDEIAKAVRGADLKWGERAGRCEM